MSQHYVLFFQLDDVKQFTSKFGNEVTKRTWQDMLNVLSSAIEKLFVRYTFNDSLICHKIGQCHGFFQAKNPDVLVDFVEQKQVISENLCKYLAEQLTEQLGSTTSKNMQFRVAIAELLKEPNVLSNTEIEETKIQAFEELQACQGVGIDEDVSPYAPIQRSEFEQILFDKSIQTHFQSIVSLPNANVVGYEALSRGPADSVVQRADLLFRTAAHFGLTEKLELLCIEKALEWVPKIPADLWISLNIGPNLLMSEHFEQLLQQTEVTPLLPRLVFELTEHVPLDKASEIQSRILQLKEYGIRLSLDDTGCGFFDLDTVILLRPEMVKLCITVIKRINGEDEVAEEIKQTRIKIDELFGITLGEGVETEEQRKVLHKCGVSLAQGYLFDKPTEASILFS